MHSIELLPYCTPISIYTDELFHSKIEFKLMFVTCLHLNSTDFTTQLTQWMKPMEQPDLLEERNKLIPNGRMKSPDHANIFI